MNTIERRHEQELPYAYVEAPSSGAETSPNLIIPILKRWRIVLITFLLVCLVGIPAVWLLGKANYEVTAAVRVAPIIPSVLFSDKDSEGVIPMYDNFKNTQADIITSERVLQRVADDLADKKLKFFEKTNGVVGLLKDKLSGGKNVELVAALKESLVSGDLSITSERRSELIKISLKGTDTKESAQIVDSLVRAYMSIVVNEEAKGGDQSLTILEMEAKSLAGKLEAQRKAIREMAQEYGTQTLSGYHEMMFQRVATLQAEITKAETRKITLQAQVELLQDTKNQGIDPEKLLKIRQDFINADLMIQNLNVNIAQMEQALIVAKQNLTPANPELKQKAELLDTLKQRLDQRNEEINKKFDEMISGEFASSGKNQLINTKAELKQTEAYEKRLREVLAKEDSQTIELGRKQLIIEDLQGQMNMSKELYEKIQRRIQELEMERKRPARISVAYYANITPLQDKRIKFTMALIFGSLGCGALLALLKDKADHSLYTPADITKHISVRIIGTTTQVEHLDTSKLFQQVTDDYQTIRANLELLNGGEIPKKLVITSAGVREGKTTFSINFSTTLAKSGKKVLLIDGDLRKPSIQRLLNLPENSGGLKDMFLGKKFEDVVCSASGGFDVLTANSENALDASELLLLPRLSECLRSICPKYDHVIIDTPPVLAFSDALVWATMADGVILVSFAGYTEQHDLKDALERLAQVKVKVLGTILNNVHVDHSYNRYGYSYYTNRAVNKSDRGRTNKAMLLPPAKKDDKPTGDSEA